MDLPIGGGWRVVVHGVEPFTIHGDRYVQLLVERTDAGPATGQTPAAGEGRPEIRLRLRAPAHVLPDPVPAAPFPASITFLLGQVVGLTVLEGPR
ncbi:MAG: hypothetical protein ACK4PI_10705 [Tepidisphaerales bacterium]